MFKLLKWLWRAFNFVRYCVMNLFFILFVFGLIAVVGLITQLGGQNQSVKLEGDQGALLLNLDGYLTDNRDETMAWQNLLNEVRGARVPRQISTFDVVYAIQTAEIDDRIKGLVLDLNYFEGADLPALTYIGRAITQFKTRGKPVVAFADNFTQGQYLLASYADEIYINSVGSVGIHGLAQQNLYYKAMLDKLGVTPHIFRVGTYKSAVEPFLRNDMSPEAKSNAQHWLNGMWQNYLAVVAENRGIEKSAVLPSAETYLSELKKLNGDSTAYSNQRKLITSATDRFSLNKSLQKLFGEDSEKGFKYVELDTYLTTLADRMSVSKSSNKIAVVNIEGAVIDGDSDDEGNVGGDTIARLLRQAIEDENIKGVIVRLNTPGGSAFASEIIRQELIHIKEKGKPVVVSMGAMAASGGYWIASVADKIIADKNTITGSIGIFAMFPTVEKGLDNIGVNADGVNTSELAQASLVNPLNDKVKDILQLEIEHGYDQFLTRVAEGRGLQKSQVDNVAQGQVWLGQDALQLGLVDELGDFDDAIRVTQSLLKTESSNPFVVEWLQDEEYSLFNHLLKNVQKQGKAQVRNVVLESLGLKSLMKISEKSTALWGVLSRFNDPKGQYLYCLTCGTVK